jgi:hypothetical protein
VVILGIAALLASGGAYSVARASRKRDSRFVEISRGSVPTACGRCGGSLKTCRRPLTLKELLAIITLIVFGWGSMTSMRLWSGNPYPWRSVLALSLVGLLPLWLGLSHSESYRRTLRCGACWTPHGLSRTRVWPFWSLYLLSITIYLLAMAIAASVRLI